MCVRFTLSSDWPIITPGLAFFTGSSYTGIDVSGALLDVYNHGTEAAPVPKPLERIHLLLSQSLSILFFRSLEAEIHLSSCLLTSCSRLKISGSVCSVQHEACPLFLANSGCLTIHCHSSEYM